MSCNRDLRYIIDHWCQFERWSKEAYRNTLTLNSSLSNTITDINFNTGSNQLEFSYMDLNGDTITNNIDLSTLSQSQFQIENVVNQFSDLASIPSPTLFEFASVQNSQGIQWLPGSLGGTYYGPGLYMWNGAEWVNGDEEVYEELNNILIRLNELVDSVTDGTGISIDNTDPNNPIVSIDPAILNLINNSLQPGDNISELTNDVGYLTTETDPVFSVSEAASFVTGDKSKLDGIEANATADQNANEVPFTPAGNTTSNNVQSAIEELQSDIDGLSLDHGDLSGLGDDDHPQYLNETRGDARYYTEGELDGGQLDNRYYTETEINAIIQSLTKSYFQSTPPANQNNITNVDTLLTTTQNKNSDNSIFELQGGVNLIINKTATFKFNILVSGQSTGGRERLDTKLQRNSGAGFTDIPLAEGATETYSYHRNTPAGRDTGKIGVILDVTIGDVFRIVLNSPTSGVNILALGTNLTVEEK